MIEVVGWVAAWVVLMAVVEYIAHRWPMHHGGFRRWFRAPFHNHAVLHHGRYFRKSFVEDDDPASRIISIRMSVTEHLAGASLLAVPLWLVGLPVAAVTLLAVVAVHALVWSSMHVEMHTPVGRWFSRTRYYRYVRDLHHAHHLNPGRNFCAVFPPFMDKLFGTYHPPVPAPEAL